MSHKLYAGHFHYFLGDINIQQSYQPAIPLVMIPAMIPGMNSDFRLPIVTYW